MNTVVDFEQLPYRKGVGLMVFNRQGLVFAAKRIDTPDDAWQMPQGGIDEGETPAEAALRELEEEIGTNRAEIIGESQQWLTYDLPRHLIGTAWRGRYRGQTQKWFALKFTGEDADINIQTRHPEFNAWQWLDFDRLVEVIVPFKRTLYQAVVTEFAPIARTFR